MNKNGFTLIELLAVIALIAIISMTVFYSTNGVKKAINNFMWDQKVALIENSAINWGEDNKSILPADVSLKTLIDAGYYNAETCVNNNEEIDCIKDNNNDDKPIDLEEHTVSVTIDKKQI
ncbi:MAG: prepilin-type N-terminal cleavage/methylation domain-containing protein, partial [Stomatobaculum sp.]|nr:prepilin-type N-terminal cleavage/methylation domain-containing protein [Stomatobaculum sp.]